jgi:hypothetical protein
MDDVVVAGGDSDEVTLTFLHCLLRLFVASVSALPSYETAFAISSITVSAAKISRFTIS